MEDHGANPSEPLRGPGAAAGHAARCRSGSRGQLREYALPGEAGNYPLILIRERVDVISLGPEGAAHERQAVGKVACSLRYQVVERDKDAQWSRSRCTIKQTMENNANNAGVVRAMALAAHWR